MNRKALLTLSRRLLSLPTAPFHEHQVRDFVDRYCQGLGFPVEYDASGNVLVKCRRGFNGPPLVLVAHMDHPGFEMLGTNRAEFLGGVPRKLFPGSGLRVYTGDGVARAKVVRTVGRDWPRRKLVELRMEKGNDRRVRAAQKIRRGDLGMWDLPMFRTRGDRLRACAIDDGLGVAAALATLTDLARSRFRTQVWAAFTRAEEVGFPGAVELALSGRIPRQAVVVSIEMSKERPWARMGDGPIVRVGDRMSTFDAEAVCFLQETAAKMTKKRKAFSSQRCLMDGGSCEATAFCSLGYRAAGVCLALGNYHNIGSDGKVGAEYVSIRDYRGLVELLVGAAREWPRFRDVIEEKRSKVMQIRRRSPRDLKANR